MFASAPAYNKVTVDGFDSCALAWSTGICTPDPGSSDKEHNNQPEVNLYLIRSSISERCAMLEIGSWYNAGMLRIPYLSTMYLFTVYLSNYLAG